MSAFYLNNNPPFVHNSVMSLWGIEKYKHFFYLDLSVEEPEYSLKKTDNNMNNEI